MNENNDFIKPDQNKEYYSGHLYDEQKFFQFRLVKTFLSRVSLADEYIEAVKKLSSEGVVVYALNQRSELNSLIIYELFKRKGMPIPVYCHGMDMSFWQPLPKMLRFFWHSASAAALAEEEHPFFTHWQDAKANVAAKRIKNFLSVKPALSN